MRFSIGLIALAAVALAFGIWSARRPRPARRPHPPALPIPAMAESVRAASGRQDWVAALAWVERVSRADPGNPYVLSDLSVSWHNYAIGQRPGLHGPRAALRNSLERMQCEQRALACVDSAERVADEAEEWVHVLQWRGGFLENLGLPGDALETYRQVLSRQPGARHSFARAYWLTDHLRDPLLPDRIAVPRDRPGGR